MGKRIYLGDFYPRGFVLHTGDQLEDKVHHGRGPQVRQEPGEEVLLAFQVLEHLVRLAADEDGHGFAEKGGHEGVERGLAVDEVAELLEEGLVRHEGIVDDGHVTGEELGGDVVVLEPCGVWALC